MRGPTRIKGGALDFCSAACQPRETENPFMTRGLVQFLIRHAQWPFTTLFGDAAEMLLEFMCLFLSIYHRRAALPRAVEHLFCLQAAVWL
jgi:hypothetical protein